MAKNTGKPSEELFEDHFKHMGKRAYCHRFVDAAEVRGRTGKLGFARPAPSDFLIVCDGETFFAEVKSTQEKTSFSFSLLRRTQSAMATMAIGAGGTYWIYLHDLTRDQWYRIPYSFIESWKIATGRSSVPWNNLRDFTYALS